MTTQQIRAEQKKAMGIEERWTYKFRHPYFGWLTIDDKDWPSREGAKAAAGSAYPVKIIRAN